MSSQQTPPPSPSAMTYISQLFSPTTLAALRYALAMASPLLALFGFAALTPDQIDHVIAYAKTFGTAAAAISALIGIVVPLTAAIYGTLSATWRKQVARFKILSQNPSAAGEEAAKAIIEATSSIAQSSSGQSEGAAKAIINATSAIAQSSSGQSENATQTLIAATIALPAVQTIVTDQVTADAAPSENVIAAKA